MQEEDWLLTSKQDVFVRKSFLAVSLITFSVLGAGLYIFPLWVSFILPNFVVLSREVETVLGALPFVGILGVGGIGVVYINSLKLGGLKEFSVLITVGAILEIFSWNILPCLLTMTPKDTAYDHHRGTYCLVVIGAGAVLLFQGTGIAMFFSGLLSRCYPLLQQRHHLVFSGVSNTCFAVGSIGSLALRYGTTNDQWIAILAVFETVALVGVFIFATTFKARFVLPDSADGSSTKEVTTKTLLKQLYGWKRQYDAATLATKDCQVRSSQMYLMTFAVALVCALATTFMANLGPLLSASDGTNDDGNGYDESVIITQVNILLAASAGQTVARLIIPFTALYIWNAVTRSAAHEHAVGSARRIEAVSAIKVANRTTCLFIALVGVIFLVFLLALEYSDSVPFYVASTAVSAAYGVMWVAISMVPQYFPGYNFGVILSVLQGFGMVGMALCTVIIAAGKFGNSETIALLIIMSIATLVAVGLLALDRWSTEPSFDSLHDSRHGEEEDDRLHNNDHDSVLNAPLLSSSQEKLLM